LYTLNWRLDGHQTQSGRGGEEEKSHNCPCRESNPGRPVRSLVTILDEFLRLPSNRNVSVKCIGSKIVFIFVSLVDLFMSRGRIMIDQNVRIFFSSWLGNLTAVRPRKSIRDASMVFLLVVSQFHVILGTVKTIIRNHTQKHFRWNHRSLRDTFLNAGFSQFKFGNTAYTFSKARRLSKLSTPTFTSRILLGST